MQPSADQPQLGHLATAVAPQRDLWPGIAQAIAATKTPRRWPVAMAAAAMLIVALGVSYHLGPNATTPTSTVARMEDYRADVAAIVAVWDELENMRLELVATLRLYPEALDARRALARIERQQGKLAREIALAS